MKNSGLQFIRLVLSGPSGSGRRGQSYAKASMLLLMFIIILHMLSCEIPTSLTIEGGTPPSFRLSGNGVLTELRVRGPKKQRDILGEDASMYWVIKRKHGEAGLTVSSLGTVMYGEVPQGYMTIYPESGPAPPLQDGERYYVQVITMDAPGASGHFTLNEGKVVQERDR
jgi:hypothetical protein